VELALTVVRHALRRKREESLHHRVGAGWTRIFSPPSSCPPACARCCTELWNKICRLCAHRRECTVPQADRFQPLIEQIQKQPQSLVKTMNWSADAAEAETFHEIPLMGRSHELLGVLLVGSSQRELVLLTRRIIKIAGAVRRGLCSWDSWFPSGFSARITKPVEELAEGAREVAGGRWIHALMCMER